MPETTGRCEYVGGGDKRSGQRDGLTPRSWPITRLMIISRAVFFRRYFSNQKPTDSCTSVRNIELLCITRPIFPLTSPGSHQKEKSQRQEKSRHKSQNHPAIVMKLQLLLARIGQKFVDAIHHLLVFVLISIMGLREIF